jgi:integrase
MLDLETYELRAKPIYGRDLDRRLCVLRLYDRFLEERGLEPSAESLNAWLDELAREGKAANTIRTYCYDVLSYFDLMMVGADRERVRLVKRRLPPAAPRGARVMSDEEVARLLEAASSPVHRLIYALMYSYARRLGEVLALRRGDVDLEAGTITFKILKRRREERATYELEPWIADTFRQLWRRLGRDRLFDLTERAVEVAFKRDCARAGIDARARRLTPHCLRHSRATSLREKGVPLDVVSKHVLRHSRYDTTVSYYLGVTEMMKASIPPAGEVLRMGGTGAAGRG